MRCEGPSLDEITAQLFDLRWRHIEKTDIFIEMRLNDCPNRAVADLQAVLEQTMQQQPATISLCARTFEIDLDGIDPVNLLVGVGRAIPDGDDQHEEIGIFLRDFRKNLDEVECPILPGILLGVGEAVVPCLEFV